MFLLLYLTLDETLADMEPHVIHGRPVGQREHINPLDPLGAVVVKILAHRHPGHQPADVDVDVGIQQARRDVALLHLPEQAAGLRQGWFLGHRCRGHQQDEDEQRRPAPATIVDLPHCRLPCH